MMAQEKEDHEAKLTQMLNSLHLANKRKEMGTASSDEDDGNDDEIANADRGTLRTGRIALDKLKAAGFDKREEAKLEFPNLYHTAKNFKINAQKTQHDSMVDYLAFLVDVLDFAQSPLFQQFYAAFDRKLRKNVVKRCLVQVLTARVLAPPIIKNFNQPAPQTTAMRPSATTIANQEEEEKKQAEVGDTRPWLLLEYLEEVKSGDNEATEIPRSIRLVDKLIRTLIQESDSLLTCTLAEELAECLQDRFLKEVVAAHPTLRDYFSADDQDISTVEMVHGFIEKVQSVPAYLDDRNVQSKGEPRKGGTGKRHGKDKKSDGKGKRRR